MAKNQDNAQKVNDVLDRYQIARDFYQEQRDEIVENRQFHRGVQWTSDQKTYLEERNRDVLVFNHIKPQIDSVVGSVHSTKFDAVAKPVNEDDAPKSIVMNNLLKHHYHTSRLNYLEAKVFESSLIDMVGWYGIRIEQDKNFRFEVKVYEEDALNIMIDPNSVEDDLSDCDYIIKTAWMSKEQLKRKYPKKSGQIETDILVENDDSGLVETSSTNDLLVDEARREDYVDVSGRAVRIVELWEWRYKKVNMIHDKTTGKIIRAKEGTQGLDKLVSSREELEMFTFTDKELWVKTVTSTMILEDRKYQVQTGHFPFIPFYCYKRSRDKWSMVTGLKDYNREINKRRSSTVQGLTNQVNSGWIAKEGSIDLEQWLRNPKIRFVKGDLGNAQQLKPAQISDGYLSYDRYIKDDMDEVGQPREARGLGAGQNESGKVFGMKVQQGNNRLTSLIEHQRLAKKMLMEELLRTDQQIYTDERVLFTIGEDGKQAFFDINQGEWNDIRVGEFDVIIDEDASSANAKEYYSTILLETFKTMVASGYDGAALPWAEVLEGIEHPKKTQIVDMVRASSGMGAGGGTPTGSLPATPAPPQ